jgi:hypothetical protein
MASTQVCVGVGMPVGSPGANSEEGWIGEPLSGSGWVVCKGVLSGPLQLSLFYIVIPLSSFLFPHF